MDRKFDPRVLDKIAYKRGIRNDTRLAQYLGVSRSTIARWRNGEGTPNYGTIAQMFLRDGIKFEEMLNGPEELAAA